MSFEFEELAGDAQVPVHPALDVVGDTLYVTVRAGIQGRGVEHVVIASTGEALALVMERDWPHEAATRGLLPRAVVDITDITPGLTSRNLRAVQDNTLTAPTWDAAYQALYDALDARIVVTDQRYLVVLTLYAMMTYMHPLFEFLPILHLLGPSESGKSRAALALAEVSFNGKASGSATAASIFRKAHAGRYTQILTETDDLADKTAGDAFVKQLQGACTKGEAVVEVTEKSAGGAWKPTSYYGFNPRVLVSTKDFRALTLRNRCIRLDFVKVPNADQMKLRRSISGASAFAHLRDQLHRLQLLRWRDIADARDHLKEKWTGNDAPTGRTFDKWLPLASIALRVTADGMDIFGVVEELAREGMQEQLRDAANSLAGILFRFMAYLVRNGDVLIRREQAWEKLLECEGYSSDPMTPQWAKWYGDAITVGDLKQMFKGERRLWEELKRKNLVPKAPTKHTREGDIFELKQKDILDLASLYVDIPTDEDATKTTSGEPKATTYTTATKATNADACPHINLYAVFKCPGCAETSPGMYLRHGQDGKWRCPTCRAKDTVADCPNCQGRGNPQGDDADLEVASIDDLF
jgi:hypothetical protein